MLYVVLEATINWVSVVQVIEGFLTTLAILVGGIWVFYVFILGRSHSASVRIQLKAKQSIIRENEEYPVISVNLKNVGQTHVDKRLCTIGIAPISDDRLRDQPGLRPIRNTMSKEDTKLYEIFTLLRKLEPEAETEANVLLPMGKTTAVKVAVTFIGSVGPTFLPASWRMAEPEDWRKEIMDMMDKRREENWLTRTIIDTRSHVTDIEMVGE
jgi:hypothetical protein